MNVISGIEESGFFDAKQIEENGNVIYDREYTADQFAKYFSLFIGNGVFVDPMNQLKVYAEPEKVEGGYLWVRVEIGNAFIEGYWYRLKTDMEINIELNKTTKDVKYVVVCSLERAERAISTYIRDAGNGYPVNNGERHELVLAEITLKAGSTTITDSVIKDRRPDSNYCGYVTGVVKSIDATDMFNQLERQFSEWFVAIKESNKQMVADNAAMIKKNDEDFKYWFEGVRDQLGEDEAYDLQVQIDKLRKRFYEKKIIYLNVNKETGDDELGDGSSQKPFKTLQKAVYSCPSIVDQPENICSIFISNGNYTGEGSINICSKRIVFSGTVMEEPTFLPVLKISDGSVVSFENNGIFGDATILFRFAEGQLLLGGDITPAIVLEKNSKLIFDVEYGAGFLFDTRGNAAIYATDSEIYISGTQEFNLSGVQTSFIYSENSYIEFGKESSVVVTGVSSPHEGVNFLMATKGTKVVIPSFRYSEKLTIKNFYSAFVASEFSNVYLESTSVLAFSGVTNKYVVSDMSLIFGYNVAALGTTSISNRGDGTVTGAIKYAADLAAKHETELTSYVAVTTVVPSATSIPANNYANVKAAVGTKSGYKIVGILSVRTNHKDLIPFSAYLTDSNANATIQVRNLASSAVSTGTSFQIFLLWQRT